MVAWAGPETILSAFRAHEDEVRQDVSTRSARTWKLPRLPDSTWQRGAEVPIAKVAVGTPMRLRASYARTRYKDYTTRMKSSKRKATPATNKRTANKRAAAKKIVAKQVAANALAALGPHLSAAVRSRATLKGADILPAPFEPSARAKALIAEIEKYDS